MVFGTLVHHPLGFVDPHGYNGAFNPPMAQPGVTGISRQSSVANLGDEVPVFFDPNVSSGVERVNPTQGTQHPDIALSDLVDELEWTPPFQACSVRVFEAAMRSDACVANDANGQGQPTREESVLSIDSIESPIETPIKGKGPVVPVNVMGSYNVKLSYLMYTEKGVNPLKTSTQNLKNGNVVYGGRHYRHRCSSRRKQCNFQVGQC
ncbi:uncharacterized protein MELLADRAFT_86084 [Melampsora larici-populina 98AG31]|uniref:Uncharacterized protein n=1 Tax=Melampsora larici-populina (strain 98AG31 / pathotype 3-4-7) TaxID=747676 RepID=F4RKQ4_MELLP|nr:uncharacterized protein MELLADRAFT_86084 [Melampsora larici-populina 98AG31]EGG07131.1 hypothetical protein MELLADRAFT_86084 [Melampsora larici-populina 98AG31]